MNINPNIAVIRLPYHSSADIKRHDVGFEHTTRMNHIYNQVCHKRAVQATRRYMRSIRGRDFSRYLGAI